MQILTFSYYLTGIHTVSLQIWKSHRKNCWCGLLMITLWWNWRHQQRKEATLVQPSFQFSFDKRQLWRKQPIRQPVLYLGWKPPEAGTKPSWQQPTSPGMWLFSTQGNYATRGSSGMFHLMPHRHLPKWRETDERAFVHLGCWIPNKGLDITMPATVNCINMKSLITLTYTGCWGRCKKEEGRVEKKGACSVSAGAGAQTRDLPRARGESQAARHSSCLNN